MKTPRILLLTDIFPANNYSGGIINQQLCYFLLEANCEIHCALLKQHNIEEKPDNYIATHVTKISFSKPAENHGNRKEYEQKLKTISLKINSYILKNNIDIVWSPIQGETILRLFSMAQKKFKNKVRFVSQIWDPLEWPLHELGYDKKTEKSILRLLDQTLQNSDYILTASHPMNEIYSKKYHTPCSPLFTSYRNNTYIPPSNNTTAKNTFIITLAGQTYAKEIIRTFISALDRMNWHYSGKEIYFKYYGNNYDDYMQNNPHIIIGGQITQDELIEQEKEANLLYCPYYLGDHSAYQLVSQQSYPSKIITYIPSGTPILVHSRPDSSVYQEFKKEKCGFILSSSKETDIIQKIQEIIDTPQKEISKLTKNADRLFQTNFTRERNKKVFLKALGIPYNISSPSYRILEINNLDLPGKRWNGYDLTEYFNKNTNHLVSQIVTYKTSSNKNVFKIYTPKEQQLEYKLLDFEANQLSVHSCLSLSSPKLLEKDIYQNADLLHLHLIHNMKLSLISLIKICNQKPSIITIHDPWIFTGRCVWLYDCKKYLTGCHNCPNLNTLFPLKCDNCHELWNLKKYVYDNIDVDYVVTTKYMYDLFTSSPLTRGKRIHLIPFGINTDEFYQKYTQEEAKKHYKIPDDHIVIFHRAQFLSKGTEYVIEALRDLDTKQKVTIITCSEEGRLNEFKQKYNIIDLGNIDSEELAYAYNACDIFLSPSIGESFCMMAVEAMSCAKPIIIFNNTALPSVTFAPECGVMAKDRDSHDLMKKIKWLIEDKTEREKRGKLAREIVCEHYDINVYHKKIQELYQEVATRKHHFIDYNSILNQEPKDSPSVLALKYKLNSLTKIIFPKHSQEYNTLLFNAPKPRNKNPHIKYGDLNTQLLINQYNNNLAQNYANFDPYKLYGSLPYKLIHKTHTFVNLLIKDRHRFTKVIKEKIFHKNTV